MTSSVLNNLNKSMTQLNETDVDGIAALYQTGNLVHNIVGRLSHIMFDVKVEYSDNMRETVDKSDWLLEDVNDVWLERARTDIVPEILRYGLCVVIYDDSEETPERRPLNRTTVRRPVRSENIEQRRPPNTSPMASRLIRHNVRRWHVIPLNKLKLFYRHDYVKGSVEFKVFLRNLYNEPKEDFQEPLANVRVLYRNESIQSLDGRVVSIMSRMRPSINAYNDIMTYMVTAVQRNSMPSTAFTNKETGLNPTAEQVLQWGINKTGDDAINGASREIRGERADDNIEQASLLRAANLKVFHTNEYHNYTNLQRQLRATGERGQDIVPAAIESPPYFLGNNAQMYSLPNAEISSQISTLFKEILDRVGDAFNLSANQIRVDVRGNSSLEQVQQVFRDLTRAFVDNMQADLTRFFTTIYDDMYGEETVKQLNQEQAWQPNSTLFVFCGVEHIDDDTLYKLYTWKVADGETLASTLLRAHHLSENQKVKPDLKFEPQQPEQSGLTAAAQPNTKTKKQKPKSKKTNASAASNGDTSSSTEGQSDDSTSESESERKSKRRKKA